MDELMKAGLALAAELENEWEWSLGDHEDASLDFAKLAAKHFAPLVDVDMYKKNRITALRAELAELEGHNASLSGRGTGVTTEWGGMFRAPLETFVGQDNGEHLGPTDRP